MDPATIGLALISGALIGLVLALVGGGGSILAVPLLIFGAGGLDPVGGAGAFKLLGAVSLVLVAGAPFVAGAAMRAGME